MAAPSKKVNRAQFDQAIRKITSRVSRPEYGIFGPESIVWKVNRESINFMAGGRAALMQLAHPYVAHGIDQHSETRNDPAGRFDRTFYHVYKMFFGDLETALEAAEDVYAIHKKITGKINENVGRFDKGDNYLANEPEALFWVYLTLIDSSVMVYEMMIEPLTRDEKQEYYEETKMFARLFGIPDKIMPTSWDEFIEKRDQMIADGTISVGEPAREIGHFLFQSDHAVVSFAFYLNKVVTMYLLPETLSQQFEFARSPLDRAVYTLLVPGLRLFYRLLPGSMRYITAYNQANERLGIRVGSKWGQKIAYNTANAVLKFVLRKPKTTTTKKTVPRAAA